MCKWVGSEEKDCSSEVRTWIIESRRGLFAIVEEWEAKNREDGEKDVEKSRDGYCSAHAGCSRC